MDMIHINPKLTLPHPDELPIVKAKATIPEINKRHRLLWVNKELPTKKGIYFIRNSENNIIYIGKAINIQNRIAQHLNNRGVSPISNKYDIINISYLLIISSEHTIERIERLYIDLFKPMYNDLTRIPWIIESITPELQRQMTAHVPMR